MAQDKPNPWEKQEPKPNPWEKDSQESENPWVHSDGRIDNPLVENVNETNYFDNAYTETFANPDPKPNQQEIEQER